MYTRFITHSQDVVLYFPELEHHLLAVLQPCGGSSIWPDWRGSHKGFHELDAIHGTSCYWQETQPHHLWGRLRYCGWNRLVVRHKTWHIQCTWWTVKWTTDSVLHEKYAVCVTYFDSNNLYGVLQHKWQCKTPTVQIIEWYWLQYSHQSSVNV